MQKPLILASASPRRKQLLEAWGIPFQVDPSQLEEIIDPKLTPEQLAKQLSVQKAQEVAKRHLDAMVLAADTLVALEQRIFGKPKDAQHAEAILKVLSGTTHQVITGFTLIETSKGQTFTDAVTTYVTFRLLSESEIRHYIHTENPSDKAGAYAIQEGGGGFVERIEGDLDNVVGLPQRVREILKVKLEKWVE